MKNPQNAFKLALKEKRHQLGIWNSIGGNTACEVLANCGFDWVLIDTEHSPVEAVEVLQALQTIAGYPDVSAVVRPTANDPVLIKRLLDIGAQSLLIPYVQSAEEARAAVKSMQYPPQGIRGVAGITRASRFGKVGDYNACAEQELCVVVQVETAEALEQLEEIATVEGVDGVFIGPADLSASMGHPGNPDHPDVIKAIEGTIERLNNIGVPAGILTLDESFSKRCIELGTSFTVVGVDLAILVSETSALRQRFRH